MMIYMDLHYIYCDVPSVMGDRHGLVTYMQYPYGIGTNRISLNGENRADIGTMVKQGGTRGLGFRFGGSTLIHPVPPIHPFPLDKGCWTTLGLYG